MCELCEINNSHDHVFIKVRESKTRIPLLSEIKKMTKKIPEEENKKPYRENYNVIEYPSLSLDISCAFGSAGIPMKTSNEISKATLVHLDDQEFLDKVSIEEIEGEDNENNDCLITCKWFIKNESDLIWPNNTDAVVLKCMSNDCLVKLKDLKITEKEMNPIAMNPGETSELQIQFLLPHRIRLAAEKNKKTLNILFSLFDEDENCYIGSNLPCTIPL